MIRKHESQWRDVSYSETMLRIKMAMFQHPPNFPLRYPKCHLIESIRPQIEVRWGV